MLWGLYIGCAQVKLNGQRGCVFEQWRLLYGALGLLNLWQCRV